MNLTTSVNGTGATDPMSQLVAKVMAKYDVDKDGTLTAQEFGGFLNGLLNGGSSSAAALQAAPAASVTAGAYRSMLAGFDFTKLENPNMPGGNTSKYKAARVFQDYPPRPESIPAVIDRLRAEGVNAVQIGLDKIDFGDGYGPIDVIQGAYPGGGVAWQWLPQ
jgi:hypothetical protein